MVRICTCLLFNYSLCTNIYSFFIPPHTTHGREPLGSRKDRCLYTKCNYKVGMYNF